MMDVRTTSFEMDDNARNRIVSEIKQNFFVEAGAGSGKTTMLVNRMVAMVEAGVDISRISAITFTKAAAGEFYDKFQSLLIERSNPDSEWKDEGFAGQLPEPTELTCERCRNALQNIDLCFMGTIDSFCNMILSEHPYEAGILSDAGIMTDLDAAAFYRQQYVKICNGEYGNELAEYANFFQSFYRNPEEVFLLGASILMDNRNAQFNYTEAKVFDIRDIDTKYASFRSIVIRALQTLIDHPELKYESEAGNLKAWENIDNIYRNICVRWSSRFTDALYGLSEFVKLRTIPQAMKYYGAALGPLFVDGGKSGKWLQVDAEVFEKLQEMQYVVTMTFLMKCVPVLEAVMRDNGNMTYFDYLYYLRNMLKKDAESDGKLIRYIYDRHSYFLIDEFQDTNPLQAEVFFYLTAEKPVPVWSECVPRKGSLFIVGDPKQSIYRFRSADVASFLRVRELFEKNGDEILTLTRNFRSTRTLCEYFNRVFAKMLPEETVNQSKFEEIPLPDGRPDEFQGVFKYKAFIGKTALTHPDETDPVRIADIIERIVDREDYKLRGKDDKEPRRIRFSDIMVISYGKKKLGPIMAELDARGIPMKVEGDVPFAKNEALQEIAKIYAAVADPYDRAALYGALTGKLIALTKEDLLKYRAAKGGLALYAKPLSSTDDGADTAVDETAISVSDHIRQLREFYSSSRHLSPAALFTKILEEYKVFAFVDADNLEVVYYTLELLRNAEKTGQVVTLRDGSRFINERIGGTSGEERCLSLNDDRDCVHMANLHKVKGLEAPVVILADAFNSSFTPTMRIQHEAHGTEGYVFALESERDENGKNRTYCKTSGFSDEAEEERDALKAENLRLLYVAATRARNVLIICRNAYMRLARNGKEVETSNSKWKDIIEDTTPDFFVTVPARDKKRESNVVQMEPSALYASAEEECVLKDRGNEAETYTSKTPSKLKLLSKLTRGGGTPEPAEEDETEQKEYPALIGTMTHKLMEELVLSRNTIDIEILIDEIIREYLRPAQQHYEDDLRTILKRVAERMRSGGYEQTNVLPKDILKTLLEADEVYCEVPFTYKDDENGDTVIWNGIIDVLYRSGDSWHIVDYKTNADGEALDEKYHLQMEAYAKAFKEAKGLDADALTYHIEVGKTDHLKSS